MTRLIAGGVLQPQLELNQRVGPLATNIHFQDVLAPVLYSRNFPRRLFVAKVSTRKRRFYGNFVAPQPAVVSTRNFSPNLLCLAGDGGCRFWAVRCCKLRREGEL